MASFVRVRVCVLVCTGSGLPTDLLCGLQAARVEPATLLFLPCHLLAHIILGPASIHPSVMPALLSLLSRLSLSLTQTHLGFFFFSC